MKQGRFLDSLFKRESPALTDLVDEINAAAASAREQLREQGFSGSDIENALTGGAAIYQKIVDDPKKYKDADYSLQVIEAAAEIQALIDEDRFLDDPKKVAAVIGLAFQCGLSFGMNPAVHSGDDMGEYLTTLANKSHRRDREAKVLASELAHKRWRDDSTCTIKKVAELTRSDLENSKYYYATSTVRGWIKDLAPPALKRGGRPRNPN